MGINNFGLIFENVVLYQSNKVKAKTDCLIDKNNSKNNTYVRTIPTTIQDKAVDICSFISEVAVFLTPLQAILRVK